MNIDKKITIDKSFLNWLKVNLRRPLTYKQYSYVLQRYSNSGLSVLEFASSIATKKKFLTQFKACVKLYGKYMRAKGDIKKFTAFAILADSIYIQKPIRREPSILTDQERLTLSEKIKDIIYNTDDYNEAVIYMIIAFLMYSGLRINECLNLTKQMIQTQKNTTIIYITKDIGKGGKERIIPMNNKLLKLYEQFERLIPANQDFLFLNRHGKLFTRHNIVYPLKKVYQEFNIPRYIHPHIYRHDLATRLLRAGASVAWVQRILGHSKLETLSVYAHANIADLQKAINLLE